MEDIEIEIDEIENEEEYDIESNDFELEDDEYIPRSYSLKEIPYIIPSCPREKVEISKVLIKTIKSIENEYSIDTMSAILKMCSDNHYRIDDIVDYINTDKDIKTSVTNDILMSNNNYYKQFIDDEDKPRISVGASEFGFL